MSTPTTRYIPDVLATLRSSSPRRRALRLRRHEQPFRPDPVLWRAGVPQPLVEAIARVATGTVKHLMCGGRYGEVWRVSWSRRGTGSRWSGVLDPRQRIFSTTASGHDALVGFAMAAIGYTWAMPACGFDGEWAALLGTLDIEGTAALWPGRLRDVATIVLRALDVDEFAGVLPDATAEPARRWRLRVVTDEGELPAREPVPQPVHDALSLAPAPLGAGSILASFGRFAECSRRWWRSLPRAADTDFVGGEAETGVRALDAGLHVILEGPAGAGKTCCARAIISSFHHLGDADPIASVALETLETPEELVGRWTPDGVWVDGPLRRAMHANDGDGYAIHLSSAEPLTAPMRHLIGRALAAQGPVILLPGAPPAPRGPRFRIVLELRDRGVDAGGSALGDGSAVAHISFDHATGGRLAQLLAHREPDLPELWRQHAVWVVDDIAIGVRSGKLARVPSLAEVRGWLRLSRAVLSNGFESDWVSAMEAAAMSTWVPCIPGASDWWESSVRYAGESVARRRIVASEGGANSGDTSGSAQPAAALGACAWQGLLEVRTTVDRLTLCVDRDTHLALIQVDQLGSGGVLGTWAPHSRFCSVVLYPPVARTAADELAVVVSVAAHERGHSRWSTDLPAEFRRPPSEAPVDLIKRSALRKRCFDILEDMRIERLLDGVAPPSLACYRRRAASVLSVGDVAELPDDPAERLLCLVHGVVWDIQTLGEGGWARAVALGRQAGLPVPVVRRSLALVRAAGEAGEARDVVPLLAARLASVAEGLRRRARGAAGRGDGANAVDSRSGER